MNSPLKVTLLLNKFSIRKWFPTKIPCFDQVLIGK
jgi:hypothetical protein